jgi:hypothetical protein
MIFEPSTVVYLLHTPLENDYKNQLFFTDKAAQESYFTSVIKHTYDNLSYQRKDNVIRFRENIEKLWDVNYCMYKNANFGSKWFYCFITKLEYVNDNTTNVYIETDVYQTWLFDTTIKESFIVREMLAAADDTIGANLIDEGLETGEYIHYEKLGAISPTSWYYVLVCTVNPNNPTSNNIYLAKYGKTLSPQMYAFSDVNTLNEKITNINANSKINSILGIFLCPNWALDGNIATDGTVTNIDTIYSQGYQYDNTQTTLNGYTPKNKKLFTYPYNFYNVINNNGTNALLRYEFTQNNRLYLTLYSQCTIGGKAMLLVDEYKNNVAGASFVESLSTATFPLIPWINDTFSNWLGQNIGSVALGTIGSVIATATGVATANPVAISSGILGIANEMAAVEQHSIMPPQARGSVNADALIDWGRWGFEVWRMGITADFAARIDKYFDMFGYKMNKIKLPNLNNRPYWNYIKTLDINIDGAIPIDDMAALKKVYDSGVTLWHNPSNYGNYELNNH